MAGRQYSSGINATYPRYANANPGLNPSLGSHALLTLSKSFSINDQVGISLKSIRQEASYDDARFGQPTQSYLNRSRSGFLKIQGDHQLRSNWSTQWQMSRSDVDQFDLMDETVNSVNRTVRTSLGWNNEFQIDSTLAATFALSRDWVVADTSAPFYKGAGHSRWLIGATKKFGPTTVDGNVSKSTLDAGSSFNDYLLGVGHQLMQSWTIFATVGQTHQMPTVGQLYHIDWGGNPNLKTETIKSNEIGIQFKDNTDLVRVVSYRAMYRDKLLSDASTGFIWENVGSAHDAGIEFSWRRMKPKWTVQATATFHQPQLDDSATPIEKTSKATFSANATYVLNHRDSLNYVLFGRSSQFSSDPIRRRTEVGGYGLSKLGWTRRWSKHQRSVVTVDNLFNKTYQEVAGYQTNNRTIFLNFVLQY